MCVRKRRENRPGPRGRGGIDGVVEKTIRLRIPETILASLTNVDGWSAAGKARDRKIAGRRKGCRRGALRLEPAFFLTLSACKQDNCLRTFLAVWGKSPTERRNRWLPIRGGVQRDHAYAVMDERPWPSNKFFFLQLVWAVRKSGPDSVVQSGEPCDGNSARRDAGRHRGGVRVFQAP